MQEIPNDGGELMPEIGHKLTKQDLECNCVAYDCGGTNGEWIGNGFLTNIHFSIITL